VYTLLSRNIKFDQFTMDTSSSTGVTPDAKGNVQGLDPNEMERAEMRQFLQSMYAQQQAMAAELAATREALARAEAERIQPAPETAAPREEPNAALFRTLLETLTANATTRPVGETTGTRDWKPPSWDGKADTFRDYLLRIRSSYRVRSATKPTLSPEYYWNSVYDTLPARERARMRHFWEKGDREDIEGFFSQLEEVYADSNEQPKALERLTSLKHANGQPWHEHQLEFDGLLSSAGGDSWADLTKIGYLKNTFSNPAKTYTAAIPKTSDYYAYAAEVERIMTNLENTDQFKAANKKWAKEKSKDTGFVFSASGKNNHTSFAARVDADGDTAMAPTRTSGSRGGSNGPRKQPDGKKRAKWVDEPELEKRREKKLCFRCGGDGHRVRDCSFAPAIRPTAIIATRVKPLLEDDDGEQDPDVYGSGKE